MKPTWVVQSNLISEDTLDNFKQATEKLGYNFKPLKIIPFTDSPEFLADLFWETPSGPLIPYGSTSLIKMWSRSKFNKSGFFFNQDHLKTSKWVKELGNRVLNHDAIYCSLKEAFELKEGTYFMKPDNDLKDFCGEIVNAGEIKTFYETVSAGGFCFSTDIPVVICPIKALGAEYRLFMVEGRVIAGSPYKLNGGHYTEGLVPKEVLKFASKIANIWLPEEVCVMDVGETEEGLKIVEFNCPNASGLYNCNIEAVVKGISQYVENNFKGK